SSACAGCCSVSALVSCFSFSQSGHGLPSPCTCPCFSHNGITSPLRIIDVLVVVHLVEQNLERHVHRDAAAHHVVEIVGRKKLPALVEQQRHATAKQRELVGSRFADAASVVDR